MSQVVSIRLQDDQIERLKKFARRNGKSQSEMGALLIEESMRQAEFAFVEFRNTSIGRQPCMKSSTLAVWEVIMVGQDHGMSLEKTAAYFNRPVEWVQAAFNYRAAYPKEIEDALSENRNVTLESLKRLVPNIGLAEIAPATVHAEEKG